MLCLKNYAVVKITLTRFTNAYDGKICRIAISSCTRAALLSHLPKKQTFMPILRLCFASISDRSCGSPALLCDVSEGI